MADDSTDANDDTTFRERVDKVRQNRFEAGLDPDLDATTSSGLIDESGPNYGREAAAQAEEEARKRSALSGIPTGEDTQTTPLTPGSPVTRRRDRLERMERRQERIEGKLDALLSVLDADVDQDVDDQDD